MDVQSTSQRRADPQPVTPVNDPPEQIPPEQLNPEQLNSEQNPLEQNPSEQSAVSPVAKNRRVKIVLVGIGLIVIVATVAALMPDKKVESAGLTHTIKRGELIVSVTEQGTLESSDNTEIICKVRGYSTVTWVIPSGTMVETGDELFRLDTKVIEETVSLQKTNVDIAVATLEETKAALRSAEIRKDAYLEGRYLIRLQGLERDEVIAQSRLRTVKETLSDSERLFARGYGNRLEVEGIRQAVKQAELELESTEVEIEVLEQYTKTMEIASMDGRIASLSAKRSADEAGLDTDEKRRDRALEELDYCVGVAEKAGLVIYPKAAAWKNTPDVQEGGVVTKDQVMLIMPDMTKMQVKVGIHESIVDRLALGMEATIALPEKTLKAEVSSIASVTKPAGWWTGNVVKYDTIVELPSVDGLKPGMSAEVKVIIARHQDVLLIPVAAVVETEEGDFCWVETGEGRKRRSLKLGDTNDVFIVVEAGLKEGDKVVLNPLAYVEEAQNEALVSFDLNQAEDQSSDQADGKGQENVSTDKLNSVEDGNGN